MSKAVFNYSKIYFLDRGMLLKVNCWTKCS